MAVNESIREMLNEDTIVFDNPAFDNSIIGMTTDGQAVYSYYKMIEELMNDDGISEEEAIEWIEYNSLRSLPYAGAMAPIVIYTLEELI
jgi:hypothetical protein